MLAATKVKMSGREKKEQEHVRYFLHKTRAKNVQKSVLHVQNCFLLIRTIVVFSPFSFPSSLSITRLFILFEKTVNIIESFAFSPGYIYILAI